MRITEELWHDKTSGYFMCDVVATGPLPAELGLGPAWFLMSRGITPHVPTDEQLRDMKVEARATIARAIAKHKHPAVAWAEFNCHDSGSAATLQKVKDYYARRSSLSK